jgi:hypothetical protein
LPTFDARITLPERLEWLLRQGLDLLARPAHSPGFSFTIKSRMCGMHTRQSMKLRLERGAIS